MQAWNLARNPPIEADLNVNRIRTVFQRLQSQKRKAIIPYITPEFPVKGTTVPLILGLEKAGASLIEVGIPFSDPIADGVTIQHSSHIAIQNGATIGRVLESVKDARRTSDIPVVLMGYVNPILRYGMERFLRDANQCGVDGVIVPDLLPGRMRRMADSFVEIRHQQYFFGRSNDAGKKNPVSRFYFYRFFVRCFCHRRDRSALTFWGFACA